MKRTDIAYVAGLVDGEGCIETHQGKSQTTKWYNIRIELALTREEPLQLIQSYYGGHIYNRQPRQEGYKASWEWILDGEKAYNMLKDIKPFLLIKRSQAEVAMRIFEIHPKCKHYTPMEKFLQQVDADTLHRLNKRGLDKNLASV